MELQLNQVHQEIFNIWCNLDKLKTELFEIKMDFSKAPFYVQDIELNTANKIKSDLYKSLIAQVTDYVINIKQTQTERAQKLLENQTNNKMTAEQVNKRFALLQKQIYQNDSSSPIHHKIGDSILIVDRMLLGNKATSYDRELKSLQINMKSILAHCPEFEATYNKAPEAVEAEIGKVLRTAYHGAIKYIQAQESTAKAHLKAKDNKINNKRKKRRK